jgi:hypothetical protein
LREKEKGGEEEQTALFSCENLGKSILGLLHCLILLRKASLT